MNAAVCRMQVAHFVQNQSVIAAVCSSVPKNRLDVQIGANGTLPLEDSRTKSENYHSFDTIALLELAAACRNSYGSQFPGQDQDYLYHYKTPKSAGTGKAGGLGLADIVDWLLVYARDPSKPWPFNQILPFDRSTFTTIFRVAANAPAWASRQKEFEAVVEQQPGFATNQIALTIPLKTTDDESKVGTAGKEVTLSGWKLSGDDSRISIMVTGTPSLVHMWTWSPSHV